MIPIAPAPPAPSVPSYINPSQIDVNDDKSRRAPKRKRTDTPDESGTDAPARNTPRHGPKKKKANRACFHCQKAHLTCDDGVYLSLLRFYGSIHLICPHLQHVRVNAVRNVVSPTAAQRVTAKKPNTYLTMRS